MGPELPTPIAASHHVLPPELSGLPESQWKQLALHDSISHFRPVREEIRGIRPGPVRQQTLLAIAVCSNGCQSAMLEDQPMQETTGTEIVGPHIYRDTVGSRPARV